MTCERHNARGGFVLPLALFMLTVMALIAALLLQASIEELRTARGEVAAVRAQAAAGSALADLASAAPDSGALSLPRGTAAPAVLTVGGDTTQVVVQALGGGVVRLAAAARAWFGGVRGDAANVAFLQIVPDSGGVPGALRYRRLPGRWWAPIP